VPVLDVLTNELKWILRRRLRGRAGTHRLLDDGNDLVLGQVRG